MAATIRLSQQYSCSFDHLVGAGEQRWRHRQAENPRGLIVDDQLELGRLRDRQVAGFFAFQHAAGVDTSLPIGIEHARSVTHQAASVDVRPPWVNSGYRMTCRQHDEQGWLASEKRIAADEQRAGSLAHERS